MHSEAFKLNLVIKLDLEELFVTDDEHFRTYNLVSMDKNKKWYVELPVPFQLLNDAEFDLVEHLRKRKKTAFETLIQLRNGKTTR